MQTLHERERESYALMAPMLALMLGWNECLLETGQKDKERVPGLESKVATVRNRDHTTVRNRDRTRAV